MQQECLAERKAQKSSRIEEALREDRNLILGYKQANEKAKKTQKDRALAQTANLKVNLENQIQEREQRLTNENLTRLAGERARVAELELYKERAVAADEAESRKKKAFQENLFLSQFLETSV